MSVKSKNMKKCYEGSIQAFVRRRCDFITTILKVATDLLLWL